MGRGVPPPEAEGARESLQERKAGLSASDHLPPGMLILSSWQRPRLLVAVGGAGEGWWHVLCWWQCQVAHTGASPPNGPRGAPRPGFGAAQPGPRALSDRTRASGQCGTTVCSFLGAVMSPLATQDPGVGRTGGPASSISCAAEACLDSACRSPGSGRSKVPSRSPRAALQGGALAKPSCVERPGPCPSFQRGSKRRVFSSPLKSLVAPLRTDSLVFIRNNELGRITGCL